MTGEDEFDIMCVDLEKKARSKWKCLGGCRTSGLELNERIENNDMFFYYCISPQPRMKVVFLLSIYR